MRLLLNAAFDTDAHVGISHYILRVAPELAKLCDLTVLTPTPKLFHGSMRTIRIPDWTKSHTGRVLWTLGPALHHILRGYDALLCPTPVCPVGAPLPVVSVVHDVTPLMLPRWHSARLKTLFRLALESLRWADVIVADSVHTKNDLLMRFPSIVRGCVHVVAAGPGILPENRESPPRERPRPYVLYVGGHARHKNLPRLIRSFAQLRHPIPLELLIVGWGKPEMKARTTATIHSLGLCDRATVINVPLTDSEMSSLYSGCSAFVYPSLYEGFGLPVLEALAHGAPVACSSTTSLPEVAGNTALYFDPTSERDMAKAIRKLLDDDALADELRHRGPRRAARFSWTKTASGLLLAVKTATTSKRMRNWRRSKALG